MLIGREGKVRNKEWKSEILSHFTEGRGVSTYLPDTRPTLETER